MTVAYDINFLSVASGIFPLLTALYNYKYLDKTLKIVAIYLFISALFDLVLESGKFFHIINNLPAIHLFVIVSIIFYGAIYYNAFFEPFLKKLSIIMATIAFFIVILNVVFVEGIWEYPSLSNTVFSVLLISFSLAYFYQLLNRQEFVHIEKQGLFWINSGVLFYFSINIFLFMLFKRIINAHQEDYYMIHNITNIIANLLFTVGLLCKPQKTT